jgi:aminopeptidase
MTDFRLKTLAGNILEHSLSIKKGERVMIRGSVAVKPLITELIKKAGELGAIPFVRLYDEEITRCVLEGAQDGRLETEMKWDLDIYKDIDADVSFGCEENDAELSLINEAIMQRRSTVRRPWVNMVVNNKKWVLLNWPTKAQAQKARMPFEDFFNFVISASSVDYAEMGRNMKPLSELMSKTDKVYITGSGTDLSFSINGIPNVICAGENNLPDGEIFTAPVKTSVEGILTYNTPCPYHGKVYNGVRLEFKDGKIVKSTADNDSDSLSKIFDTDEGARYIGEFALGVNPMITRPFGNILFDEKIMGSFHFTPGMAYETANNGNSSSIHWDMVCIQTPEYGGGEIWFDGVLIRKDGMFVLPELRALNP